MKKYLTLAILKATAFNIVITFILVAIIQIINEDKHSKYCYMPWFSELLGAFIALVLSVSLLFIFFNLLPVVRQSKVGVFLSFYLIPIIITIVAIIFCYDDLPFRPYLFAFLLPLFLSLTYWYIRFKKKLHTYEW